MASKKTKQPFNKRILLLVVALVAALGILFVYTSYAAEADNVPVRQKLWCNQGHCYENQEPGAVEQTRAVWVRSWDDENSDQDCSATGKEWAIDKNKTAPKYWVCVEANTNPTTPTDPNAPAQPPNVPDGYQLVTTDCYYTTLPSRYTASFTTSIGTANNDCFRKYQYSLSNDNQQNVEISVEGFIRTNSTQSNFNAYVQTYIDQSKNQGFDVININRNYTFSGKPAIKYLVTNSSGYRELNIWVNYNKTINNQPFDTFLIKAKPYAGNRMKPTTSSINKVLNHWVWR